MKTFPHEIFLKIIFFFLSVEVNKIANDINFKSITYKLSENRLLKKAPLLPIKTELHIAVLSFCLFLYSPA